jgi:glycosyltransferase involved in cell wall biosynthesis
MPTVSFIIPIYQVELWLPACLDSLLNQTWADWEAILVDDGSPDKSGGIAKAYALKDSRFKVIHQTNKGLGGARNTGVENATGEFLFFLDSDDMVPAHAITHMVNLAHTNEADMVVADYWTFRDGEEVDINREYPASPAFFQKFAPYANTFTWKDMEKDYELLYRDMSFCLAWGKLFKANRWKEWECHVPDDLRMAEDFIPVKRFVLSGSRITVASLCSVLYRKRPNSATTRKSLKSFEIFRAIPHALSMFQATGITQHQPQFVYRFLITIVQNHMLYLTPNNAWHSFFKKAHAVTQSWPHVDLPHPEKDILSLYQKGTPVAFAWLLFRYWMIYQPIPFLRRLIGKPVRYILKKVRT